MYTRQPLVGMHGCAFLVLPERSLDDAIPHLLHHGFRLDEETDFVEIGLGFVHGTRG
jgi:hypothetical protein